MNEAWESLRAEDTTFTSHHAHEEQHSGAKQAQYGGQACHVVPSQMTSGSRVRMEFKDLHDIAPDEKMSLHVLPQSRSRQRLTPNCFLSVRAGSPALGPALQQEAVAYGLSCNTSQQSVAEAPG